MFERDTIPPSASKRLKPEYAINGVKRIITQYLEEFPVDTMVIGVSGGVDSALTAAIIKEIDLGIRLLGRVMPIETNKPEETQRGIQICESFCDEYKIVDLEPVYHAFITFLMAEEPEEITKIQQGNIKARLRMVYLYHVAQKNNGLVLSTDNLTELMLGFWTLHGDVGDLGMLQNMWKTEVYDTAKYLANKYEGESARALQECIDAVPTDGLGVSNTDFEQLGANSYDEIDKIIKNFFFVVNGKRLEEHPVMKRVLNTRFKRVNPFNIDRLDLEIG